MKIKNKKPKVAIVGLTCCEGCEFAILDLGQRFLDLAKWIDLVEFRMVKDDPPKSGPYDICFIEGSAVTKKNLQVLKELRKVSKKLIVLGNCAHTGGIHRMKNFIGRIKAIGQVYNQPKGIDNPPVLPISEIVKVDFVIPTCPINAEEFLAIIQQILAGKTPQIPQNPVCYQCQINGYECLLQKGELCCGPITLGGCQAVCLKSKQACWGCRGLLEEPDVDKFVKNCFLADHPIGEITRVLEVFGVRDDWGEQAVKEWKSQQTPKDLMVVKKKSKIQMTNVKSNPKSK
ncbi:MAG: NADH:ubiquinone oxidoreductase [Patescibacteria group bacterium]|jgi:coenzyme F420-reducing hydrogenase gamma subunit